MRQAAIARWLSDVRRSSRVKGVPGFQPCFALLLSAPKIPTDSPGHAGCHHKASRALRMYRHGCRRDQCAWPHERLSILTTFSDLGLAAPILNALAEKGYATPTPIQAQAIPSVMAGEDLLGIAQTGTGKTAAFALPILDHLSRSTRPRRRRTCRALILSPTRELATQIANSFRAYGRHLGLSVAVVVGGVSHRPQAIALARGVDVLVATPGRLMWGKANARRLKQNRRS